MINLNKKYRLTNGVDILETELFTIKENLVYGIAKADSGDWFPIMAYVTTGVGPTIDDSNFKLVEIGEEMIDYFCVPVCETLIYGKVYLFDYAARNKTECVRKVMQKAWDQDKFGGPYQERLNSLGWKIVKMKIEEIEE